MDLTVNEPVKAFLKKFDDWYSGKVQEQLQGKDINELESVSISPINLSLTVMKHVGAQWLVEAFNYIQDNPTIVVNGFVKSGITTAAAAAAQEE